MRKFLTILGGIALIAIIILAGTLGTAAFRGHRLDTESKAYVDRVVPAIISNWDSALLLREATPELLRTSSHEQVAAFFSKLSPLGALIHYDGAKGESGISYWAGNKPGLSPGGSPIPPGETISGAYEVTATFANGTAVIKIDLRKRDDRWMINGFHVDAKPVDKTA